MTICFCGQGGKKAALSLKVSLVWQSQNEMTLLWIIDAVSDNHNSESSIAHQFYS